MMRHRVDEDDPGGSDQKVERPKPSPPSWIQAGEWVEWFGVARLVTSAVAVVVVCAGAWWLVRSPTPPPAAALPFASGSLPATVTLPTPTSTSPRSSHDAAAPQPVLVVVHVAGAVARPGIYELGDRSRVADAVDAAGGLVDGADSDRINLAAMVVDGTRIHVPVEGEEVLWPEAEPDPVDGSSVLVGPFYLNSADIAELDALPGVGPATAAAIVTDRERNGPFVSVADLARVPGIGPAKLSALDGMVTT